MPLAYLSLIITLTDLNDPKFSSTNFPRMGLFCLLRHLLPRRHFFFIIFIYLLTEFTAMEHLQAKQAYENLEAGVSNRYYQQKDWEYI